MKQTFQGLRTIRTSKEFILLHTESDKEVTGNIERKNDGYRLYFTRPSPDPDEKDAEVDILLSKERSLDKEDLNNVNEILEAEKLSFVKFK